MRESMLLWASLLLASCAAVSPGGPRPRASSMDLAAPLSARSERPADDATAQRDRSGAPALGAQPSSSAPGPSSPVGSGWDAPAPQEPDYSLTALFNEDYGDFILKYEPFRPDVVARIQFLPEYEIDSETGDFDLYVIGGNIEKDLVVSHNAFLTVGGTFDARRYDVGTLAGFFDETLYQASLKLGGGFFADRDLLIEGIFEPGLWSDFDGTVHGEDFDWHGGVLATWRNREDFYLKFGVRYNEVFVDANVLPWVGLSWLADPEWRVDILLPEKAEVSWVPSGAAMLSLGLEIQGDQFHIRNEPGMGKNRFDINVQEFLVYAGGTYRFDDHVSTHARVGLAVAGDYKLRDGLGTVSDGTLDPGFFAEIGLGFTF